MSNGNAASRERVHQPAMDAMESRQANRLPAVSQSLGGPPIYGAGPNNAEPLADDVQYAELGSGAPPPQTKQRRLLLGTSSFTRYLRSLGAIKNGGPDISQGRPSDSYESGSGRGTTKGLAVQNLPTGSHPRPFHIRLDVDNHSYSRDTVGDNVKSGIQYFDSHRNCSPDEYRRSTSSSTRQYLNRVPEEMEVPPSDVDEQDRHTTSAVRNNEAHQYYGSVGYGSSPSTAHGAGPRYIAGVLADQDADDEDSDMSEEEEEWLLDEELAREGLYRGNYKNLVTLYTLVPFSTIFTFVFLALLPTFAFRSSTPSLFPYPPYLPFPLPELLISTALWSLSYLLRDFLYATALSGTSLVPALSHRFPTFIPILTSIVSALLQSTSSLFFRQLAIPILLIPYYSTEHVDLGAPTLEGQFAELHKRHFPTWQDDAFRRVWWVAIGWAAAEAVVGIKQGYESIALYKDVLVTAKKNPAKKVESIAMRGDEEDQLARAASRAPVANLRAVTPTQSHLFEEDSNSTPTQRDRQESSIGNSTIKNTQATPRLKRTLSDSLSSITSDGSHSQYVDHRLSDGIHGERQPLLKVDSSSGILTRRPVNESSRLSVEDEVERDIDQLLACKSREELEEVYGMPVIRIPVIISCLHRINSILSSLGICLLLTAAYMRSTFAYTHTSGDSISLPPGSLITLVTDQYPPSNRPLAYTIPPILILQVLMSMMHTPWVLPRIGIHTFVYVGLLVSLGLFFGGLGVWEALT